MFDYPLEKLTLGPRAIQNAVENQMADIDSALARILCFWRSHEGCPPPTVVRLHDCLSISEPLWRL